MAYNNINFKYKIKYSFLFSLLLLSFFIYSCANQLPPTGGEDDKTPPKVLKISPKPNTINFKGNTIRIEFNKYVDRRSFRESFYISPKPAVEPEFNWGGKDVEIKFPEPLKRNKTYSFLVTKGFKDFLGNNLNEPIQFAVSTGDSIDNGNISGKVFTKSYNNIIILAYSLTEKNDTLINPLKISPEYLSQVNENGLYIFSHITKSKYRIFALKDVNKNMVYDKGVDEISVLPLDISMDSSETIRNVNFLFKDAIPDENSVYSSQYINTFFSDTANFIFSSLKNNEKEVPVKLRIFLHFKENKISRYDIAENLKLFDSTNNKYCKVVLNWTADTLLELFPVEKLNYSSEFILSIDLRNTQKKYLYQLRFNSADEKRFGRISGSVINRNEIPYTIFVKLFPENNNVYIYSQVLDNNSSFLFSNLLEGKYNLFAFIDGNGNGVFDAGNAYPYAPSERFFIFEPPLNLKGNWSVENVAVRF